MYVIRSTHSSRLKRFPSRSMRSSYRTSMLVKDEADIVSLFIQYRGPRHSMIEGGVRSGVPGEVAYKLTLRTMKGTAELLLIDGLEPMQLFRMVATPNGTTEAGWKVMEARGFPRRPNSERRRRRWTPTRRDRSRWRPPSRRRTALRRIRRGTELERAPRSDPRGNGRRGPHRPAQARAPGSPHGLHSRPRPTEARRAAESSACPPSAGRSRESRWPGRSADAPVPE